MKFVPVVDSSGNPLDPCHPAKARKLVRSGEAKRRFKMGIFYIQLTRIVPNPKTQPTILGVDPGTKREGYTVKTASKTYLNIQSGTPYWVRKHKSDQKMYRMHRRYRKTPYRACRKNRKQGVIPPSVKARWDCRLRVCKTLAQIFPISSFVVEDIVYRYKKNFRRFNVNFTPLQQAKNYFYEELKKIAPVKRLKGIDTYKIRNTLGLKKIRKKTAEDFYAHCVDSWCLAYAGTGGNAVPDDTRITVIFPLQFHRRQLHDANPMKGGRRKPRGSTRSQGFKRGDIISHPHYGLVYVGGTSRGCISIHRLSDGYRIYQKVNPTECTFVSHNSWRYKQV